MEDEAIKSVEDEILASEQETKEWDEEEEAASLNVPTSPTAYVQYAFDKEKHIHTLAGRPLHGVTTVLGVIAKPMLIQWAANQAVDYIQQNFPTLTELLDDPQSLTEVLDEARIAHRLKKETAGDWGTRTHEAIEYWIKEQKEPEFVDLNQQLAFNKLKQWVTDYKVKFIASEKHVWSESLWIGGICDFVAEIDGKKYIGDFKTSSGIYNEAFFQIAAYDLCMQEMGMFAEDEITGYIVVNLKKDGMFQFKRTADKKKHQVAFKSALALYKVIKSLN